MKVQAYISIAPMSRSFLFFLFEIIDSKLLKTISIYHFGSLFKRIQVGAMR